MMRVWALSVAAWVLGSGMAMAGDARDVPAADAIWDHIRAARIEPDPKTGSYKLVSTPLVQGALGREVTLYGSVQVLERIPEPGWFIFLRDMSECGACDLGDPTKIVKVFTGFPTAPLGDVVTATGRLTVGLDRDVGWVYQLEDATFTVR